MIYFLLLLSSQLCFGTCCLLLRRSGAQSLHGIFPQSCQDSMFSPALLKSPGTLGHFLHVHVVSSQHLCVASAQQRGAWWVMTDEVTRACDSHWALQTVAGFNVVWQANEGKCQWFEAFSGNWKKQTWVLFISTSEKDFYKNLMAILFRRATLVSFLLLCVFLSLILPNHHTNIQRKRKKRKGVLSFKIDPFSWG